jgi:peptidoglycan/LPS O-acetylase OafA/YrhL
MNQHGMPGSVAVVAFRLVVTTLIATALWYGFESRILRLKRFFENKSRQNPSKAIPPNLAI